MTLSCTGRGIGCPAPAHCEKRSSRSSRRSRPSRLLCMQCDQNANVFSCICVCGDECPLCGVSKNNICRGLKFRRASRHMSSAATRGRCDDDVSNILTTTVQPCHVCCRGPRCPRCPARVAQHRVRVHVLGVLQAHHQGLPGAQIRVYFAISPSDRARTSRASIRFDLRSRV